MSKTKHIPTHLIIVPDGISFGEDKTLILKPSFVYRHVLDYALQIARDGDYLYLAPANCSGDTTEHDLAHDYILRKNTKQIRIYCPALRPSTYVDTYGNAIHLKKLLGEKITLTSCELVCAYIHSYRAAYCFRKAGFNISKTHRVYYRTASEKIARRWWYYKYKPVHYMYELLAWGRDILNRDRKPVDSK